MLKQCAPREQENRLRDSEKKKKESNDNLMH